MKEKFELVVSSKGQTVIPKKVRESLGIEPGSKLLLTVEDKKLILRPIPKDPFEELLKLSKEMKLTEKEIKQMIKESKREWSKL